MISGLSDFKSVFFIGIAGTGMSAIAQWLAENGKEVSGSDRYFQPGAFNDTREKLEALGIQCFLQNGEGITNEHKPGGCFDRGGRYRTGSTEGETAEHSDYQTF